MPIAGIDIGTTGCKCSVYSEDAELLAESYREYAVCLEESQHGIDPQMVWEHVLMVLTEATKEIKAIAGIGITSFGEASVLLDEEDKPLMQALLFTDPNGEEECEAFTKHFGRGFIYEHTGLVPGKMYSVIKWKWIANHHPEIFSKCRSIFLFEDYIAYRLSGMKQMDYALASRTMAIDLKTLTWHQGILEWAGVKEEQLPQLVPIGTKGKRMKASIQKQLGLTEAPQIITGCHDQMAAAIGTGALSAGIAVDGIGTVECMSIVFDKNTPINAEKLAEGGYAIAPYTASNHLTYAFSYTGGALLKWYRNEVAPLEASQAKAENKTPYEKYNEGIDLEQPSGLLIYPYFAGAGTPWMNQEAKGMIFNLSLATTRAHIYQGLMEGVSYEMKLNLDTLEAAGLKIDKVYATGGGATAKEWLQIKANIYNKEIVTLETTQSGTLGCMMLSAVACGVCETLEEARDKFVHKKKSYYPIPEQVQKYQVLFEDYKRIHEQFKHTINHHHLREEGK